MANADGRGTGVASFFNDKNAETVLNDQGSIALSVPQGGTYDG